MAAPLKDFRGKITPEADCVLEAMSRVSGKDRAELVRDVLHEWAVDRLSEHSILQKLLAAEGLAGAYEGIVGKKRAGQGSGAQA